MAKRNRIAPAVWTYRGSGRIVPAGRRHQRAKPTHRDAQMHEQTHHIETAVARPVLSPSRQGSRRAPARPVSAVQARTSAFVPQRALTPRLHGRALSHIAPTPEAACGTR